MEPGASPGRPGFFMPGICAGRAQPTEKKALMRQDEKKARVARAALDYLPEGGVVGVGTGSTADCFIELLAEVKDRYDGAVASSEASARRLEAIGMPVLDLNSVGELAIYVDGADEANPALELIKGGGAALTREKIVAAASRLFVCIVDESKQVPVLGRFPLPVEVIPMATHVVSRRLETLGGRPVVRQNCLTDNGNNILDVHGLHIDDPRGLEASINMIPGVVTVGLFAHRPADVLLVGTDVGVETVSAQR